MNKQTKPTSIKQLIGVTLLISALLVQFIPVSRASATQISDRSLTLIQGTDVIPDGGSSIGGNVKHEFKFKVPTGGTIGSIKFEYCTIAVGECTMPEGLVTNGATADVEYEEGAQDFTLNKTANGAPYLTRTAANVDAGTVLTYRIKDITNPTAITNPPTVKNQTFFVRISTYASTDASDTPIDTGTVAASTADGIDLSGAMPESLIFCTGKTIGTTDNVPDCSKATDGAVDFNQLFSPTDTATATSQMSASTNAGAGYNITVNGPTLQSGSNSIAPMLAQAASAHGVSQFGLNLKLNETTTVAPFGAEVTAASTGTNYKGQALPGYSTKEQFKFNTTAGQNSVANSAYVDGTTQTLGGSDAQIYTASYIVNVPGSQPAGTYTSTITYICTPTF